MQLINEEQFAEMQADLAELIGLIQSAQNNFNSQKLKTEIVSELKESLRKNSLFKSLENESLELDDNLRELKKVKKIFDECKNKSDIKLIITSVVSMFVGGLLTLIIIKFLSI